MYFKPNQKQELTRVQMEMARKGFRGKLVRLRFSPQFIVNNADELLAIAHTEYARAIEKGVEVDDPVAWTIHCAWRRTQNLLHADSYRPRMVSSEKVPELVDECDPSLEETLLEAERRRKIREAVEKLTAEQRKVIALTFFEGMSVREAASYLSCSAGKVQHHRDMALAHLRRLLPVKVSDELELDFGMAAWLAIAGGGTAFHLPAGFEALLDRAGHGASGFWARAHDAARRFTLGSGGDAAGAVASSGAGRAAGVCATGAAIICFAGASTGIVGPGVGGGLGVFGAEGPTASASPRMPVRHAVQKEPPRTVEPAQATTSSPPSTTKTVTPTSPSTATSRSTHESRSRPLIQQARKASRTAATASTKQVKEKAEAEQVEQQTSGFARAEEESTPAPTSSSAAASSEGSSDPVTVVKAPASPTKSTSSAAANQASSEFGFEK